MRLTIAGAALALGLGALALAPPPAGAQQFGQNKVQYRTYDWRSIGSDHFEVYFYPGLDSLAMRTLDLAEKAHVYLSGRMGHSLTRRVPIIIYGSHNDFSQTNITPEIIDGSTGGFTEALRNRVVLPFTGSYEDFRHVVTHELTHAVQFDLIYQGNAASMISRQSFFSPPLWFNEGLAEYNSLGMEPNAEMYVRDGTINDYLPPLAYTGGYLAYKQGQCAIAYLVERFGEDRLRDLLQRIRAMGNFDHAFQRSIGMTPEKFDQQFREAMRAKYWPTVADKREPDKFARRLTDHRTDTSNLNTAPAVSPEGDRIAYFSDRKQYTEVYVMSALDGHVLRRLVRGERNNQFEAVPSFRSSLTWSPDGKSIALVAKSGGRDVLYVLDADNGQTKRHFELPCEALYYPAWSPVSDSIVVVGVKEGRSDLWIVRAKHPKVKPVRLTNDTWDEKEPAWSPDGRTIAFASDRATPVVLHAQRLERGYGGYDIYQLDLASGRIERVVDTAGEDSGPVWSPDGMKLGFISDRDGTPNAYVFDRADSAVIQLTNVSGGIMSMSWSRENDRVVFCAFNDGGYDVFTVREPIAVKGVLPRLRREHPEAVMTLAQARLPMAAPRPHEQHDAALAAAWPDTLSMAKDTLLAVVPPPDSTHVAAVIHADSLAAPHDSTLAASAPPDSLRATAAAVISADSLAAPHDSTLAVAAVTAMPDSAHAAAAVTAAPDSAHAAAAVTASPDSLHAAAAAVASPDSAHAPSPPSDSTHAHEAEVAHADSLAVPHEPALAASASPDSAHVAAARSDSLLAAVPVPPVEPPPVAAPPPHTVPDPTDQHAVPDSTRHGTLASEPPSWSGGHPTHQGGPPVERPLPQTPLVDNGGPFAVPDSVLAQPGTPYRVKLAADYAGGGIYGATGYGAVGAAQFQFSDFLGNHELQVATDVFISSLQDLNAYVLYSYLPRRVDYSFGIYHFTNYFSSTVSTLGEEFAGVRNYTERTLGVTARSSYPFSRFKRIELNLNQEFLDRTFYDEDFNGNFNEVGHDHVSVTEPMISLVGDNALFGYYGPVNGHRYELTVSSSFPVFADGLDYRTVTYDTRRYFDLTHGYTFAGRGVLGASFGPNPQTFRIGGFSTLRGYPDFSMLGSRAAVANLEFRFPFISQLGLVGPLPIGLFNLRGAAFTDVGMTWNDGDPLRLVHEVPGGRALDSPKVGFGVGVRSYVLFLLMKLDVAWPTDLQAVGRPRWHFSIGPEF